MKDFGYEQHFGGAFELKGKSFSIFHSKVKGNDPRGLNRTFVLCYLYFCFCLELSPLVYFFQSLCKNNAKNKVFGELSNFALIGAKCEILY